jgi:hypothetical protein
MAGVLVLLVVLLLGAPARAQAQAPRNDARTAPQRLNLPATIDGTTRDSTLEADEPPACAPLRGSVFYELTARSGGAIVVQLQAAGDLDAVLDVFRRTRSQLDVVDCDVGDRRGRAELAFEPRRGATYLIRVGQRANSVEGNFRLAVFAPEPPPQPPGRLLPERGVMRRLHAVRNASDAWSAVFREGTTYRINLAAAGGQCVSLAVYAPGTRRFRGSEPLWRLGCGGYRLFTPAAGEGGRHAFLVSAQPRRRGAQRYHLQVDRARRDDTSPGLALGNYTPRRGTLRGNRIDAVDLYRFIVLERSDVELRLRGPFTLQLVGDAGRRIARSEAGQIVKRVLPGRYFVAVRARAGQSGRYRLLRATRAITSSSVRIDGRTATRVRAGRVVDVRVTVSPAASGPARVTFERLDPLAGWQFDRVIALQVTAGAGHHAFMPPSVGRWRVTAEFRGTRAAAPSFAGRAYVVVDER